MKTKLTLQRDHHDTEMYHIYHHFKVQAGRTGTSHCVAIHIEVLEMMFGQDVRRACNAMACGEEWEIELTVSIPELQHSFTR